MNQPTTDNQTDLLAKLSALLSQAAPNPQAAAPLGFQPMPPAMAGPQHFGPPLAPAGIFVAVNIETPQGTASCYVQLPPSAMQNPAAAIQQLAQAGWPIRFFQPRTAGNGGNFGGNGWQQNQRSWGRRAW